MLCLVYHNGKVKVLRDIFPDSLIFRAIDEKHTLYIAYENKKLSFEKDYEILQQVYKMMHNLRLLNKYANDVYVNEIVREYETLYKGKTIYAWIKQAFYELKNNN